MFGPVSPARGDTVFQSGQVFASVGFSTVNVYDANSGNTLTSLADSTGEPYTAGSAFDSNGNFYVTDDTSGDISEFGPDGTPMGQFATGLQNPLSLVFDSSGNLYVGQQTTPYIAEFTPSGQRLPDIGPLQTELYGDDWIDLSSDQCTFYYTTEGTDVMRYNKCTNTQMPTFNHVPLKGLNAFEVKILDNGDVLVADSNADVLLDPTGNVIQTYPCSSLPGCGNQLFAIALDPDATSFWTADSSTGNVYRVDLATGAVRQTMNTHAGYLYGLSVKDELQAATSPTTVSATPTSLAVQPVAGNFSSPTPVSAVLTDSATNTPIPDEQVTFTLNGTEACTGTTDDTGTATCVVTPEEPSQSYTLTASFSGDSSASTPIGSDSSSTAFTVNPDDSSLIYMGPTTAVNGQPVTLSGSLTTDTPTSGTPLPTKVVTFTVGSGSTSQSCSDTTDPSGNASCTINSVDQPVSSVPVTASFGGDVYNTPTSTTTNAVVTEPTTLTVHTATGDYADATTVSGVLTDSVTNAPIPGEPLTFSLDHNETCTGTTDTAGTASCSITPSEPAGTYQLAGSFGGDSTLPLHLTSSTGSSNFVVTLEQTWLTYTGATVAQNGQPLAVSGVLSTDDPAMGAPIAGRTVTFTLGSGATAQTCSAVTDSTGTVACNIASVAQAPGPIPVTDTFAGDAYYQTASASSTVNLPEGTSLTVNPAAGTYNGPTPVSGTLTNTYTGQPVPGEPVTFTVNGTQTCTATTNTGGVASCPVTPTEPAGTYSLTTSFPGDNSAMPQLLSSSSTTTFTVTPAPTTLSYTGPTSLTNGQPATFSGVLTTNEPSPGTDVSGGSVTFTIGSGPSAQNCTGTTIANGDVSCTISSVNQSTCCVPVSVAFGGNNYYQPSAAASTATVRTPTTLTVSAGTGPYGGATTVTGSLTNAVTGKGVPDEPVTLTLNGTQSCTGVTNAQGVAGCTITPNEAAGSYTVSGSFGGDTRVCPQLLSSTGSNTFVVTKATTTSVVSGPTISVSGMSTTLSGTVSTSGGSGPAGVPVTLTLGSGSTAQSCTGTAAASGSVSCTIPVVNQTAGTVPLTDSFGGNSYYQSSSSSVSETTASMPSGGGGFVVGDVSAGAPTNGTTVNFWGSQLWKKNVFSGVNNSPASMKGYIDNAPNYACAAQWTSDPGNSSGPPATIPVNMVVVVASAISQSGSTEYGNIEHLVVVHVAPGYGPAPGHQGYGTIIATLC
ncbi:MAG TPA: Ig-like domain repeat protein [Acidimicrobiales bacterium]|nr:Ig-like domain repeat protein [Acidimicrobiales bacterium]